MVEKRVPGSRFQWLVPFYFRGLSDFVKLDGIIHTVI